jgi:hypothetical protein
MLVFALLLIGISARFLPHAPNFSPVLAIALFGGVYLRRSQVLWVPLALMILTDIILGPHVTMPFTWASVIIAGLIGLWVKKAPGVLRIFGGSVACAVIFFLVTNFGCWLTAYPLTMAGLVECFTLAVPFFRMSIVSTLMYAFVLFGVYELVSRRVKDTRLAFVLLNK